MHTFVEEFEIKAAIKMIYPYLSTEQGLAEWFADKVERDGKNLVITWDNDQRFAKIISQRMNKGIKFRFLNDNKEDTPQYLEFKLNFSDLTETAFLTVRDHSDMDDDDELLDLWEGFISKLKEVLGDKF